MIRAYLGMDDAANEYLEVEQGTAQPTPLHRFACCSPFPLQPVLHPFSLATICPLHRCTRFRFRGKPP